MELTPSQLDWVGAVIRQFHLPYEFHRKEDSDIVTPAVLEMLGDALRIHQAFSRQALSKDRFEFALEKSLNRAGIQARLVENRTNRGHDITIRGVPVSLKTQADAGIRVDSLHISKFMELARDRGSCLFFAKCFWSTCTAMNESCNSVAWCLGRSPTHMSWWRSRRSSSWRVQPRSWLRKQAAVRLPSQDTGMFTIRKRISSLRCTSMAEQNASCNSRQSGRIYASFTRLGGSSQRPLSSLFLARFAYSSLISMPVHWRSSSLHTTPVVPEPKNGSRTLSPTFDPAVTQSRTNDLGKTAKCAPAYGSVLIFQTLRLFFRFSVRSCAGS